MPGPLDWIPTSGKFQTPENGAALWEELEQTAHERIITSQHDFVKFLQRLHVPDDGVHFPPEGGWPEISRDSFAATGKSDTAMEVLRSMAYIEGPSDSSPREILIETQLADYREPGVVEAITAGDADEFISATESPNEPAPRDEIGLTIGGRGYRSILLDCRYGIVRWIKCGEGRTQFGVNTKRDPADEGGLPWGGDTAWPVEEFFEYIKAKFLTMEQLSYNQSRLIRKDYDVLGVFEVFKEIYRRHGWPGSDYQKEVCMREVRIYCMENHIN